METRQNCAAKTDADGFIVHVKFEDVYADFPGDVEKIFDTSSYEVERLLTIRKNKKKY